MALDFIELARIFEDMPMWGGAVTPEYTFSIVEGDGVFSATVRPRWDDPQVSDGRTIWLCEEPNFFSSLDEAKEACEKFYTKRTQ